METIVIIRYLRSPGVAHRYPSGNTKIPRKGALPKMAVRGVSLSPTPSSVAGWAVPIKRQKKKKKKKKKKRKKKEKKKKKKKKELEQICRWWALS